MAKIPSEEQNFSTGGGFKLWLQQCSQSNINFKSFFSFFNFAYKKRIFFSQQPKKNIAITLNYQMAFDLRWWRELNKQSRFVALHTHIYGTALNVHCSLLTAECSKSFNFFFIFFLFVSFNFIEVVRINRKVFFFPTTDLFPIGFHFYTEVSIVPSCEL